MKLSRVNSRSVKRLNRGLTLHLLCRAHRLRHVVRKRGSPDYAEHVDNIYKMLKDKAKKSGIA